ncbi:MAG: alpha/beta hydrolase [Deltaproteobacteria bacterium]|nr:alpha/beta hydrolase [Deltaproteobacteria bacterium]
MIEAFQLPLPDRILAGALHVPEDRQNAPWVVLCHGLFSSMASEKFTQLAGRLCRSGIAALRFDFSGCGASTGSIADTTVTRRLQELDAFVRFAESDHRLGRNNGLMGSSLGGFVGLLYAQRRPFNALSVWATPYELSSIRDNIPPHDLARLKPDFFTDAAGCHLDAERIDIPLQIIHGSRDAIVPVSHAEKLQETAPRVGRPVIIDGADHTISDPQHRSIALEACCAWFQQHLLVK